MMEIPPRLAGSFNTSEDVQVWHNDGFGWTSASGGLTPTGTPGGIRRVTLSNWSDFSAFAIANISGALPVKFGPLKAFKTIDGIKIKWTNYTESNIRYYYVERSADARSFTAIATVNPSLNNGSTADYSSLDASPFINNNFYRIAAIETNGTILYSNVIRVNLDKSTPGIVVFPNPAGSTQAYLQLTDVPKGIFELKIVSSNSQLIARKSLTHDGGSLIVSLHGDNLLKPGFYIIQLYNKEISLQNRFIVR